MRSKRIMIVEDEYVVANVIARTLKSRGYETIPFIQKGEHILERAKEAMPDLILMDVSLAGKMDGITAARQVNENLNIPVIFLTAHDQDTIIERAKKVAPYGFITKPFTDKELFTTIEIALYKYEIDRKLIESEQKYRTLFNQIDDPVIIVDKQSHHVLDCNAVTCQRYEYQYNEVINQKFCILRGQDEEDCAWLTELETGFSQPLRDLHITKSGKAIHVEITANEVEYNHQQSWLLIVRNITSRIIAEREQEQMAKRMQMSQRLEAIGRLAGGIAHDFNNILMPVAVYLDMAMESVELEGQIWKDLQHVERGIYRAKQLVQQILIYSRKDEQDVATVNVSLVVKEVVALLHAVVPVNIRVEENINRDIGLVYADPSQMHQLIMNLCVNAKESMSDGGILSINLDQIHLDLNRNGDFPDLNAGDYICIIVKDTGCGISENDQQKIYDPFFTTKGEGSTGLGLSVVYGIVKRHGGGVSLKSEIQNGSSFTVLLPLAKTYDETNHIDVFNNLSDGTGNILFVDDEEESRQMGLDMLSRAGYQVEIRNSGEAALEVLEKQSNRFNLLIFDYEMTGINGIQLATKIRKKNINTPIIILTGFATHDIVIPIDLKDIQVCSKQMERKELMAFIKNTL
ncbi:response regulator [bacterium]|nr:response regulator [bacterium]